MTTMPVYEMVDTWNAAGTVFTAIGMNVTDNLSASGSMLIDLQVGGTSQFHVTKSGVIHGKRANFNIASANAPIVSVSNYSLTGSNADSLFDLAGTWNTSGTPTALKLNITDTASNASSRLMDLQVGGASRFSVGKNGAVTSSAGAGISSAGSLFSNNAGVNTSYLASTGVFLSSVGALNFSGNADGATSPDLILTRDAADTLAQRRGTNAQTFRIYNTFTDASNYERLDFSFNAATPEILARSAGTGAARGLNIGTVGAANLNLVSSNTIRWRVDGSGHFIAAADNTYDIGASGANRPRAIYSGLSISAGSTLNYGNNRGLVSTNFGTSIGSPADGVVLMTDNAQTSFGRLQFGGTTSSFPALKRSTTTLQVRLADDSADAPLTAGRITAQTLTIGLGGQTAVASNTALGFGALNSASLTGTSNVGVGYQTLNSNTTGGNNSAVGVNALLSNTTGGNNSAVGRSALFSNTTGSNNSATGAYALNSNTTASDNSATGYAALYSNTTASDNSATGYAALYSNTTGASNSAVGRDALYSNTTGSSNSAMGRSALQSNTTGGNNSAMGRSALYYFNTSNNTAIGYEAARGSTTVANNTGSNLTAVGHQTLLSNTSGSNNSAVGIYALYSNTTGSDNSATGAYALYSNTTGSNNSAVGTSALLSNTTGGDNSAMGRSALFSNTTGNSNSAMGVSALQNNTTGGSNSAMGRSALFSNTTGGNNVGLGHEAGRRFAGSNNTMLGRQAGVNISRGVNALGAITGGSGYTDGTYNGVTLTRSSGSTFDGAPTANITVSGGAVTAVTLVTAGTGFQSTDTVLTASASSIGGTGSGWSVVISSLTGAVSSDNTLIGHQAGDNLTEGSRNIIIGSGADADSTTGSDQINIGDRYFHDRIRLLERTSDPAKPAEGNMIVWMSDGTGLGDDGDVIIASTAGGVTNYAILFDHSAGTLWP